MYSNTPSRKHQMIHRVGKAAVAFVSAPASARPLAFLRVGLSALLLVQALAFAEKLFALFGPTGVVQWGMMDWMAADGVPRIAWLAGMLGPYGVSADQCVQMVFLAYVGSLGCLLIGWHSRVAAVAAWLTHLALMTSGAGCVYGVDVFANIALFYCVWMPVGHAASMDRIAGRVASDVSPAARLGLRVLQIQMCTVYLASGIEKASGEQWWNGEAMWRAVMWPTMAMLDFSWLAYVPWLAMLLCWGTLAVEVGYAFLCWYRGTRPAIVLATIGLHAGIAIVLGLWSFSAVMIVLNVAAFLVSAAPAALHGMQEESEPTTELELAA